MGPKRLSLYARRTVEALQPFAPNVATKALVPPRADTTRDAHNGPILRNG